MSEPGGRSSKGMLNGISDVVEDDPVEFRGNSVVEELSGGIVDDSFQ